ncbi:acyl-CoA thioesterase II [Pseudomonas sp. MAP12]|uniref:Acyl-CoA thioesterase II n=1 Tax=Geopseudomonas aromaticivorans TaxID=2849492 RepID=A0ABS6N2M0_9GAMM|nr:acyl-CoA thioesterase II [Pseudomonas aromaticivorans]MBV2134861.1 acyl-CoA thioesterase II [Pseudomonas aromaticivorans]
MSRVLDELVALLSLETIEENLFRGVSQDLGLRQLFGGQVIGQSLSAASQTVPAERHMHSMHAYFLRPGDATMPVLYQVDRVRDGGSFNTRRVLAIQKGQPIYSCSVSFQCDEGGLHHQVEQMPDVPGPEGLLSEHELHRQRLAQQPDGGRERAYFDIPIEVRPVNPGNASPAQPRAPIKYLWVRADGQLPDVPALHKYLMAYATDFGLLTTALLPHGVSMWDRSMQVASLDHALWFHRNDVRVDDWLLFALDSPWAGHGRGFTRGSIFNRAGELVASAVQEGLIRQRPDWA